MRYRTTNDPRRQKSRGKAPDIQPPAVRTDLRANPGTLEICQYGECDRLYTVYIEDNRLQSPLAPRSYFCRHHAVVALLEGEGVTSVRATVIDAGHESCLKGQG